METVERLTEHELLALAGLLRAVVRSDGLFSAEERRALEVVAMSVAPFDEVARADGAYRTSADAGEPLGGDRLFAWIERAGRELVDDAALRAAALKVTRLEAREAIHALLFEVAASDMITAGERATLDWLAKAWGLARPRVDADESEAL